jgi:hypothetical protein
MYDDLFPFLVLHIIVSQSELTWSLFSPSIGPETLNTFQELRLYFHGTQQGGMEIDIIPRTTKVLIISLRLFCPHWRCPSRV